MTSSDSKGLILRSLSKSFGSVEALRSIELDVAPGELLALTGPSGAGKTTTCRIIAGLEHPDSGDVVMDGESVVAVPAQKRGVAFMFESYALYPNRSVRENIMFPLGAPAYAGRYRPAEVEERVRDLLRLTEMVDLQDRKPAELSGGQKQRVALCRALVQEPSVYLLDEPIAHLDAKLRHKLRGEIRQRLIGTKAPALWCTPDAMEAIAVGDRVAVLVGGELQQVGTPVELYHSPTNVAVAKLVGDPPINLITGGLRRANGTLMFEHESFSIPLPARVSEQADSPLLGESIVLGVRPTSVLIGVSEPDALPAQVYTLEPFGKYSILTLSLGNEKLKVKTSERVSHRTGDQLHLRFETSECVLFDETTGRAIG